MLRRFSVVVLALGILSLTTPAFADLTGATGTASYNFPGLGNFIDGPYNFSVTPTDVVYLEHDTNPPVLQNTISAGGINVLYLVGSSGWTSGFGFNGEVFTFNNATILGVNVDTDLPDTMVTFDSTHIYIDNENVASFNVGDFVNVTVEANTQATPEPSSLILLGTGLLGAMGAIRRKYAR